MAKGEGKKRSKERDDEAPPTKAISKEGEEGSKSKKERKTRTDKKHLAPPDAGDTAANGGSRKSANRASIDSARLKKKSMSAQEDLTPEQIEPTLTTKTDSYKDLGNEEWNSEQVKNHKLTKGGFTCCIVLTMEDSVELTQMGHFLHQAIKTGIRRRFITISADDILAKVQKYVASKTRPGKSEDTDILERMDLWAEALKHKFIQIKLKTAPEQGLDSRRKDSDPSKTRSKEFVQPSISVKRASLVSDDQTNEMDSARDNTLQQRDPRKKKSRKSFKSLYVDGKASIGSINDATSGCCDGPNPRVKTRSAFMRKRGEYPFPSFEEIDDAPPRGPLIYILLEGFYNPAILKELSNIGVIVDGILLMTDKVGKRNFSVTDIEDSIPGITRPSNVFPNYFRFLEQQSILPRHQRDTVGKFWEGLSEFYNDKTDNSLKECALINFVLPTIEEPLDTATTRGTYSAQLLIEATQRIYEMLAVSCIWFDKCPASATNSSPNITTGGK